MTQWHPIFAHLLRTMLQEYYEVQTNVAVGDLPREADILVLRRSSETKPPFQTLWRHLSRWNILEFKGRSENARVTDVDLLVEVGLGIHRRLQEQEPEVRLPRREVSFWYLANHLGKRFLRDVIELTGDLNEVGPGLWRGQVLGRPLWFVSNRDVPIDQESVPLHLVSDESTAKARELAKVVTTGKELWKDFGVWLAALFPQLSEEIRNMAAKKDKDIIHWELVIELMGGLPGLIDRYRPEDFIKTGSLQKLLDKIGLEAFLATLSPEQREAALRQLQSGSK